MSRKSKKRRTKQKIENLPEPTEVPQEVMERLDSGDIPESLRTAIESGDIKHAVAVAIRTTSLSAGPIPDPEILKGYQEIVPGSAERIMGWAEEESNHRREIERSQSLSYISHRGRGQIMAFIIALTAIVTGGIVASLGQPWAGGSIAVATALAIGGISLFSRTKSD